MHGSGVRALHRLSIVLLAALALAGAAFAGEAPAPPAPAEQVAQPPPAVDYLPNAADAAMLGALAAAREGLARLAAAATEQERDIAYTTAIDGLTALHELHGLAWAGEELARLYAQPDCPWLICGYSADGRLLLRVQALELQNPAFADYTIVLCSLVSHSALELSADQAGALACELADGAALCAEPLAPEHPLWPELAWGAESFNAPLLVPSGLSRSYKQIFGVPNLSIEQVSAVILEWGPYRIELRRPLAQAAGQAGDEASGER